MHPPTAPAHEIASRSRPGERVDGPAHDRPAQDAPSRTTNRPWRRLIAVPVAVAALGLAVTGAVTATARVNYLDNEQRMITLQSQLTASTLQEAPIDLERRLGRPAGEAALTAGSPSLFRQVVATSVGGKGPLAVAELFRVSAAGPQLVARVGGKPALAPGSARMAGLASRAAHDHTLTTTRMVRPGAQRLGYAMASETPGTTTTFVVYGEQVLPASRRLTIARGSPDADLDVAIYFGKVASATHLIGADVPRSQLPLTGTVSRQRVPFGTSVLTLVASARGPLAGPFAVAAAWIIMALGLLFTAGVTLLAVRLTRRRHLAEAAASENERRYESQRRLSESLQEALLPRRLPLLPDVTLAARYLAGAEGVEVGGDWYDVVDVGGDLFFCVGDVSGRGVDAAVLMGQIRHAINAHAADGCEPDVVLEKADRLVDVARDDHFATVLCGRLRIETGDVVLANAGHLPPVIVDGDRATIATTVTGPPVGVGGTYGRTELRLPPGAVFLAVTDGLVERRNEHLDVGLERLRRASSRAASRAGGRAGGLDQLLDDVLSAMVPGQHHDDIAMLGIRWAPVAAPPP
ncbi:MAG: PP2C family protein-serine/threonine phosphatase [Acidimicrobiales bacterium]